MFGGVAIQMSEMDEKVTPEWLDSFEFEELAAELIRVREFVRIMRDVAGRVEQAVANAMAHKKVTVPGIGVLEKNVDVTRKEWDHKALASKLVANALEKWKVETGEVLDQETANVVLEAIEKACRTEWRMGGLREYSINADDYCTTEYGSPKVRIYAP